MKRFALLIVAVLMVGCSSNNSPVAPNVIYNVTGGEAVFKVELKDYPLVVDSIPMMDSIPNDPNFYFLAGTVLAHIDIPVSFKIDSTFNIQYNPTSTLFFTGDSLITQYPIFGSEIKNALIVDSVFIYSKPWWNGLVHYMPNNNFFGKLSFKDSFRFDIQMNLQLDYDSLGNIIGKSKADVTTQLNAIKNKSWFTFKISNIMEYQVLK